MCLHLCKECQNACFIAPGRQLQRCVACAGLQSIPGNERWRACHVVPVPPSMYLRMCLHLCKECQTTCYLAPGRQLQRCVACAGLESIPAIEGCGPVMCLYCPSCACICAMSVRMHATLLQAGNCSGVWPLLGCRVYLEMNVGGPVMLSLCRPPCACICANVVKRNLCTQLYKPSAV
jgi:hypothetical protein